jgi:hypothetical protein
LDLIAAIRNHTLIKIDFYLLTFFSLDFTSKPRIAVLVAARCVVGDFLMPLIRGLSR